jgi:mitogen-activated protein kinase kinase kinase
MTIIDKRTNVSVDQALVLIYTDPHSRARPRPPYQSSNSSMPGASRLASIVSTSAIPKAPMASKSFSYRLPDTVNQGGLTHLLTSHPGLPERLSTNSALSSDPKSDDENDDEPDMALPRPTLSANPTVDAGEERERLEWRSMLASVLSGDVLRGESSRIGLDKPGDVVYRKKLGQSLWWQIRARLRSRSEAEEKKRTEERRGRVVDAVLEEIEGFNAHLEPEDEDGNRPEHNALEQVTAILSKLDLVEALYPHQAAVRAAKTLFDSPALQKRIDALTAWSTVVTALQAQLAVLQKWTGSEDLDVTRPNTTKERALVGKNRYHPLDAKGIAQAQAMDQAADDSTFIERVMKQDNVQKTFQKRVFHDVNVLVLNAKSTVIDFLPVFEELKLPDFRYEIVRLIGFPGRLIIEMLKVRLDAEKKLDRDHPNPIVINDMIYNFRVTISLAVLIKRQYTEVVEPDADKRWDIPPSLTPDYDAVLLDGLRAFFNLLQLKLKDGDKATYFRETEVLEDEWEFLCEAAEAVDGGDQVVAQLFWYVYVWNSVDSSSLTYRLLNRVGRSFGQQLQSRHSGERPTTAAAKKAREVELIAHFGKMLDTARMRYRKLQRFAR